jgi:hypothetical protein
MVPAELNDLSPEGKLTSMITGEAESLRLLSSFIRPVTPEEAARRAEPYTSSEGGYLTRETIMNVLLGEFC